jgi:two-component system, OmpR family, response regulator
MNTPNDRPVVLVVEDDVAMNELERELLAVHGFRTAAAYTGKEALDVCDRIQADAVLLDIMLPEMDGYETCLLLRQRHDGHLPIVIVSTLTGDVSRRRGFASGADAYFSKPFDPEEVINTLNHLINNHRP